MILKKEIRKWVSDEFKNRLEMIWEDMSDDELFQEMFHSKFKLFYDDCIHEGVLDNLSWFTQLNKLENKLEKYGG